MRVLRIGLITVFFALLFLVSSASGLVPVELAYDKSNAANFLFLGGKYGHTVAFTPPNTPWPIQRVRIYGLRFGEKTESMTFTIEIWLANGTELYNRPYPYSRFRNAPSWVDIDITGPVARGPFVVGLFTGSTPEGGLNIGYDATVANTHSEIVMGRTIISDWSKLPFRLLLKKEEANWMIRVVGGGGTLPGATTTMTSATSQLSTQSSSQPTTRIFGLDMSTLQGIGGVAATAGAGFMGWYLKTRKRRFVSSYLMKVDSTYNEYSMNREECKKRLTKMKEESIQLLKKGRFDEPHFKLVDDKLTQYLKDLGEEKQAG